MQIELNNHIMNLSSWNKRILSLLLSILICSTSYANDNTFKRARELQHSGNYDEAIKTFKRYLSQPINEANLSDQQFIEYTEALVQLMNTFQSKGDPEGCISTLKELFKTSHILQNQCLRDYHSVMGYALSRTEKVNEAEESILKAFSLPLYRATPERYFRDYAYAAAVFYSNPQYQNEVINWCQEALTQAELCKNTSGKQWVTAMLGSHYKRNGHLDKALELFQQSKDEALSKNDDLGMLNSLHTMVDLFLYWGIPEYANHYASEAIRVEKNMTTKNPMVTAQTYIDKGWALHKLGEVDSVLFFTKQARKLCQSLPYNSGMVDVNLLHGTFLTNKGGDSLQLGIEELQRVVDQATNINRAKAYHQLAQTYLKNNESQKAETMLDSMYTLLTQNDTFLYIQLNYESILNYYIKAKNHEKVEQYAKLMLKEQQAINEKSIKFNLVESIVKSQTEQKNQELKIAQLKQANQRLWFLICVAILIIVISCIVAYVLKQRKQHKLQIKKADEKLSALAQQINQLNAEEEVRAHEIEEFLKNKDNRHELESLTPTILQTDGESKFRQYFELLYPLFLPRIREKVPSITPREELLSMLIVLKQDNKRIAELMAIAPRSVLMLRHRFRQKIGMTSEYSLDNFIEDILENKNSSSTNK